MVLFSKFASASLPGFSFVRRRTRFPDTSASAGNAVLDTFSEVGKLVPTVESGVGKFTSLCNTLQQLLERFTTVLNPLFPAASALSTTWSILCGAVTYIFRTSFDALSKFQISIFSVCEDDDQLFMPVAVALTCLLGLFLSFATSFGGKIVATWQAAILACSGYLEGAFPGSWVPSWLTCFSGISEKFAQFTEAKPHEPVFTSSTISSLMAFVASSAVCFFFTRQGVEPRDDRDPLMSVLKCSGGFEQKCSHLFTFFLNVKLNLGDVAGWIIDCISDVLGVPNPTLTTMNKLLKGDDLFQWIHDVDAACAPEGKIQRFADPNFPIHLKQLVDRGGRIRAACVVRPVVSFLSERMHEAFTKLDKICESSHAHKGIGAIRQGPFMVQWYGKTGVGKTIFMSYFIEDLLNLMGEPTVNRLYAVPRGDAFWSGYANQKAILMDGLGAIMDANGQCEDVKQIIGLKSSQSAMLDMAHLESKGIHFTSKYIFATSNNPDAPPSAGMITPDAFSRLRDLLVEVTVHGPLDTKNLAEHLQFSVRSSLAPHGLVEGAVSLSYEQLLHYTFSVCQQHFDRGNSLRLREGLVTQTKLKEARSPALERDEDIIVESCKYAYTGSLHTSRFFKNSNAVARYQNLADVSRRKFLEWKTALLFNPIKENALSYWIGELHPDWKETCLARIPLLSFDCNKFFQYLDKDRSYDECLNTDEEGLLEELKFMPERTRFSLAILVRYHAAQNVQSEETGVSKVEDSTWYAELLHKILQQVQCLPKWVQTLLKMAVVYSVVYCASSHLHRMLSVPVTLAGAASLVATSVCNKDCTVVAQGVSNASQDSQTVPATAQENFSMNTDWKLWAEKSPFLQTGLRRNVAVIKLGSGSYFRAMFVNTHWLMTVKHAFINCCSGYKFELISGRSVTPFILDTRKDSYIEMEDNDVAFINVQGIDGEKKNLIQHFVPRGQLVTYRGASACLLRPELEPTTTTKQSFVTIGLYGVKMQTSDPAYLAFSAGERTIKNARTLDYEYAGIYGDGGSLLLLPNAINQEPIIVGIHIAGCKPSLVKQGLVGSSSAAVVFREDLEELLPKIIPQSQS